MRSSVVMRTFQEALPWLAAELWWYFRDNNYENRLRFNKLLDEILSDTWAARGETGSRDGSGE